MYSECFWLAHASICHTDLTCVVCIICCNVLAMLCMQVNAHTLADDAVRLPIDAQCIIRSVRSETAVVYPSSHHPCCIELTVHSNTTTAATAAALTVNSDRSTASDATASATDSTANSTGILLHDHIHTDKYFVCAVTRVILHACLLASQQLRS
jgi:hypothetical protein